MCAIVLCFFFVLCLKRTEERSFYIWTVFWIVFKSNIVESAKIRFEEKKLTFNDVYCAHTMTQTINQTIRSSLFLLHFVLQLFFLLVPQFHFGLIVFFTTRTHATHNKMRIKKCNYNFTLLSLVLFFSLSLLFKYFLSAMNWFLFEMTNNTRTQISTREHYLSSYDFFFFFFSVDSLVFFFFSSFYVLRCRKTFFLSFFFFCCYFCCMKLQIKRYLFSNFQSFLSCVFKWINWFVFKFSKNIYKLNSV